MPTSAGWLKRGDLFSDLRGPATGARVSWQIGDRWRPSVALYGPPRHAAFTNTVLAYRDRLEFGPVTVDGEIATDASHFLRGRVPWVSASRSSRPTVGRDCRKPRATPVFRQRSALWRGLMATGGLFQSDRLGQHSTWQTVGIRVPVHRIDWPDLRAHVHDDRHQPKHVVGRHGRCAQRAVDVPAALRMGRHARPSRRTALRSTRPVAVDGVVHDGPARERRDCASRRQWQESGPSQNWLEAQTTMRLTRQTLLQINAPVPQVIDADRVRVVLEQGLAPSVLGPGRIRAAVGVSGHPVRRRAAAIPAHAAAQLRRRHACGRRNGLRARDRLRRPAGDRRASLPRLVQHRHRRRRSLRLRTRAARRFRAHARHRFPAGRLCLGWPIAARHGQRRPAGSRTIWWSLRSTRFTAVSMRIATATAVSIVAKACWAPSSDWAIA